MGVDGSIFTRATSGHAGLSALISTRCYPVRLVEGATLPAMSYQFISSPPSGYRDHDGSPDRWLYRVQLDGWDISHDKAKALGDQMFAAFEGWQNGTAVGACHVENHLSDYDTALNKFRYLVEIVIDHKI